MGKPSRADCLFSNLGLQKGNKKMSNIVGMYKREKERNCCYFSLTGQEYSST